MSVTKINAQWVQIKTEESSLIDRISIVDDDIMWIGSQNKNSVSYTTDGGESWYKKDLPESMAGKIGGISATSSTTAYCVVSQGEKGIYKTINSGDNWVKQSTGFNNNSAFPNFIHFWNENDGVVIGDAYPNEYFEIYTTNDGGEQWNLVPNENMPSAWPTKPDGYSEWSYNGHKYFNVRNNTFYFITNRGRIFISDDKGLNWSVVDGPIASGGDMSVDFKDSDNGLVSFSQKNSEGTVFKYVFSTTDGGQNWNTINTNTSIRFLKYMPTEGVYFGTNRQGLVVSNDDGVSWEKNQSISFEDTSLGGIAISTTGKVLIGGWGDIFYSTNQSGINPYISEVSVTSSTTLDINFSENVELSSSQNINNYEILFGTAKKLQNIVIVSATRDNNNSIVHLVTQDNLPNSEVTIKVKDIKDVNGYSVINTSTGSEFEVDNTLSINNSSILSLSIYPNPTKGILKISRSEKIIDCNVEIYSVSGKLLNEFELENKEEINISNLPIGIYTIRFNSESGNLIQKIIKQ